MRLQQAGWDYQLLQGITLAPKAKEETLDCTTLVTQLTPSTWVSAMLPRPFAPLAAMPFKVNATLE